MRRNMSGNLGLYKYLWPGSVCNSISGLARTSSSFGQKFTLMTVLWRDCHIFEVVNFTLMKISHPPKEIDK